MFCVLGKVLSTYLSMLCVYTAYMSTYVHIYYVKYVSMRGRQYSNTISVD